MAQKAAKQQASRNTSILKRTHLISLAINSFFILLRLFLLRASCTRTTYVLYGILSAPALIIEFWFERIGRPVIAPNGELKKSGEDLEAKGLTEYMWDVLYWTWGCTVVTAVFGNKAWWAYVVVPLYSVWLAWSTFGSMKAGMAGIAGGGGSEGGSGGGIGGLATGSTSNRQKKLEKRVGLKTQYR